MFFNKDAKAVANWLFFITFMVFAMVVVGGATRLTESGLSMVNWNPIMGAIPPLTDAAWLAEFSEYQTSPQYKLTNTHMSIEEFKGIFWWEWAHRLLGRVIGIVFLVPMLWFWLRGRIPNGYKPKLVFLFVLGGLQGFLGWYMVMSGLVDEPAVSHYRLTAHLSLALIIMSYAFWQALNLLRKSTFQTTKAVKRLTGIIALVLVLQLIMGGLVAGLKAGYTFNTWPLMGDSFIPAQLFGSDPWYIAMLNNATTTQFDHRIGAYLLVMLSLWLAYIAYKSKYISPSIRGSVATLNVIIWAQVVIGIIMLLKEVPVSWGTFHQGGGVIVLLSLLYLMHLQSGKAHVH